MKTQAIDILLTWDFLVEFIILVAGCENSLVNNQHRNVAHNAIWPRVYVMALHNKN